MCSAASETSEVPTRNRSGRRSRRRRPARAPRGRSRVPSSASSRTSTGGMTGVKPLADELVDRVPDGRQVQPHEVAEQVGEARARRARAALDVDHAAGQVEVVARLEAELRLGPRSDISCSSRPPRACPRPRVSCGRFGSASMRRLEARVRVAQRALELAPAARAARPRPPISAAARARPSWPRRSPAPRGCARRAARRPRSAARRRRSSSASTSSSRPSASRRASAARTRSVSERMTRMSSMRSA